MTKAPPQAVSPAANGNVSDAGAFVLVPQANATSYVYLWNQTFDPLTEQTHTFITVVYTDQDRVELARLARAGVLIGGGNWQVGGRGEAPTLDDYLDPERLAARARNVGNSAPRGYARF